MKNRSAAIDATASRVPACWQREAPSHCLRVELPSGELHLFPYQHLVTASLERTEKGSEILRIAFSSHNLEVEGRGLRDLLLSVQDFTAKWLRAAPERYQSVDTNCLILAIRIAAVE